MAVLNRVAFQPAWMTLCLQKINQDHVIVTHVRITENARMMDTTSPASVKTATMAIVAKISQVRVMAILAKTAVHVSQTAKVILATVR